MRPSPVSVKGGSVEVKVYGEPIDKKDEEDKEPDKWEIQSAVDCLLRAEEIKKDTRIMKYVNEEIDKKKSAINSLSQLKKVAYEKGKED